MRQVRIEFWRLMASPLAVPRQFLASPDQLAISSGIEDLGAAYAGNIAAPPLKEGVLQTWLPQRP
jgi:hypothetical protein